MTLRFALMVAVPGLALLILVASFRPTETGGGSAIIVETTDLVGFNPDGNCALDEAINAANLGGLSGDCDGTFTNTIEFDIGAGTPVINVTSALPAIVSFVEINGNSGGATRVELRGDGNVGTGLFISSTADDTIIRNLVINSFTSAAIESGAPNLSLKGNRIGTNASGTMAMSNGMGVYLYGDNQVVGGTSGVSQNSCTGDCNLISGNQTGIYFSSSSDGVALGNFIGTNVTGTAAIPNGTGVHNQGENTLLGGGQAGAGNLISGNTGAGADMYFNPGTYQGNRFGTNAAGTAAIPNGTGIYLNDVTGGNPVIGGTNPEQGNVISGNTGNGIEAQNTVGLFVFANVIGRSADGSSPLGNGGHGIELSNSTEHSLIGGQTINSTNVIANNGGDGIRIDGVGTSLNRIGANSIYSNGGKGIETINGGNGELAPPVITSAQVQGAGVGITGTSCASCFIAVHSDDEDEGRLHHGIVQADPSGDWAFDFPYEGPNLTAFATDANENSSEFSAPYVLFVPTPTPSPEPSASPTPTPTSTPTVTPTPTASPTPTATPTPIPTPTAGPTQTPGPTLLQGDVQCDGDVDTVDALQQLRDVAALETFQEDNCLTIGSAGAIFGDVDCDGDVDSVDALKVLRHVAALPVTQTEPCTDLGDPL